MTTARTEQSVDAVLMDILDGKPKDSKCKPHTTITHKANQNLPSNPSSSPTTSPKPLTVMAPNNLPVVVEDPVRFRKQLQDMVMSTMMSGMLSDGQIKELMQSGNMVQIAMAKQMMKAAKGDLEPFKYIMDRVLGKPVNQTNTVAVNVTYEQFCAKLDPDEKIKPKDIISVEI